MPFDLFDYADQQAALVNAAPMVTPPVAARQRRGRRAYDRGRAAEETVLRRYEARGARCLARRWRGQSGEIDLIFRHQGVILCVEVKSAATHERALESLSAAQMARIYTAASEFLGQVPEGQLAELRFDVATVDGMGVPRILENAFGHL
ncbi:YraN family protein [Roseovarius nubinhibens]|uniref:YraN family protein n=1 Tax=Roseovarius nubinhibens TaxID=314263 RepID=UPI0030EE0DE3